MPFDILVSRLGLFATADRINALAPFITPAVGVNLLLGGYHLMTGLLLGVVKLYQIHNSKSATAHQYINIGHRASLLYGFASFQLAGAALVSAWPEHVNVLASIATQSFFVQAVLTYVVHGFLEDTTNQLKKPYKLGEMTLPPALMHGFLSALVLAEVIGCGVLCAGMAKTVLDVISVAHNTA